MSTSMEFMSVFHILKLNSPDVINHPKLFELIIRNIHRRRPNQHRKFSRQMNEFFKKFGLKDNALHFNHSLNIAERLMECCNYSVHRMFE